MIILEVDTVKNPAQNKAIVSRGKRNRLLACLMVIFIVCCPLLASCDDIDPLTPDGPIGGDWRVRRAYSSGKINDKLSLLYCYYTTDEVLVFYFDSPDQVEVDRVECHFADNPETISSQVEFIDLDGDGNREIIIHMDPFFPLVLRWWDEADQTFFYNDDEEYWLFDEEDWIYYPNLEAYYSLVTYGYEFLVHELNEPLGEMFSVRTEEEALDLLLDFLEGEFGPGKGVVSYQTGTVDYAPCWQFAYGTHTVEKFTAEEFFLVTGFGDIYSWDPVDDLAILIDRDAQG